MSAMWGSSKPRLPPLAKAKAPAREERGPGPSPFLRGCRRAAGVPTLHPHASLRSAPLALGAVAPLGGCAGDWEAVLRGARVKSAVLGSGPPWVPRGGADG